MAKKIYYFQKYENGVFTKIEKKFETLDQAKDFCKNLCELENTDKWSFTYTINGAWYLVEYKDCKQ